jgi:hypothetical protein
VSASASTVRGSEIIIRKKVRIQPGVELDAALQEAMKTCIVRLVDAERRYLVVECDDEASLDALRDLGCEITEDRRYVPDCLTPRSTERFT